MLFTHQFARRLSACWHRAIPSPRQLALILVVALVTDLSSPFLLAKVLPDPGTEVLGKLDIFRDDPGEFLYQTSPAGIFTARFGDKADKLHHRVRLEQAEHALEISFLPKTPPKVPLTLGSLPPALSPEATSSSRELISSPAAQLATPSAGLAPAATELVKSFKSQLKDINSFISTVSAKIREIEDDVGKITKKVNNLTAGTRLSFQDNKVQLKNNEVVSGVDISYQVRGKGLKETIILKDKQQLKRLLSGQQLKLDFSLKLEDLTPSRDEEGNWSFRAKDNHRDVFTIFSPRLRDSVGATASAQLEFNSSQPTATASAKFEASIKASSQWLTSPDRVYPVTIERTIQASPEQGEDNPMTTPFRDLPVDTSVGKPSPEDFLDEPDYSWQVRLPPTSGGTLFYRFNQKDNPGRVKVIHRDGWFFSSELLGSSATDVSLVGNQISWQSKPGVISRYLSLPNKLKADYIIKNKEALEGGDHNQLNFTINFNDEPPDDRDELTVFRGKGFLRPRQNKEGTISFIAENDQEVFTLPLPEVIDAIGQKTTGSFSFKKIAQGTARLTITVPGQFLNRAVFPLTIDPTVLDADVESWGLNWGYGRSIIRTANNKLVACWADNAVSKSVCRASDDDGASWGSEAQVQPASRYAGDRPGIYFDQTDGNVFYLVQRDYITSINYDLYFYKGTLSGTTISFSSGVVLDYYLYAENPMVITDTENNRPAVAWRINSVAGAKKGAIRFLRCDAGASNCDTAITNWCNAAGTNCGTAASTRTNHGSADEMGVYTAAHTSHYATLNQMPGSGTRSKDLYLWWTIDANNSLYYNYADWDDVDSWTWQGAATEDSTITTLPKGTVSLSSARDETNNKLYLAYLDENGTTDNYTVFERDTSNTKTSRGTPATESRTEYPGLMTLTVDSGTIYAAYHPGADTNNYQLALVTNSSGTTWSSEQIVDAGSTGTESNVHITMSPKTANNRIDLLWRTGTTAPFKVEFGSWHTKETRAVSSQTSLPTDDSITLTGADDFFFDEQDYDDTESSNNVYDSGASADTATAYLVYYFKDTNTNNTDNITPEWEGQFSQACSAATAYLQIYNWGGGGCTAGWETLDSSTTCSANTDFILSGTQDTNLSCYYGTDTFIGTNAVALRVYKQSSGTAVSGKTDDFSQNATLFTAPSGPTLDQLLRHGGWFNSSGVKQPFTF